METEFLNFHDEEHFSGFSLPLDQHDMLEESHSSLMELMQDDFHYNLDSRIDSSAVLWGTEQELNGDMAVLPDSGVATVYPKMEHIKEDFAKMLTDWQEHIGSLQASDPEEDIDVKDMVGLDIGVSEKVATKMPDDIFEDQPSASTPKKRNSGSPVKVKIERSETPSKPESYRTDTIVKAENTVSINLKHPKAEIDTVKEKPPHPVKMKIDSDKSTEIIVKNIKKENIESKDITETEMEDCIDVETVSEQVPVLEAGDVKSLLEQFEASEAVTPRTSTSSNFGNKLITASETYRNKSVIPTSKSILTPLKKPAETVDSTLHQNIMDSLPKEVIDRIKASGRKRVIPLIPAIPTKKSGTRSSGTRMQDAAATLSRNKLLKIVTSSSNGNGRADGSVHLDHDYCSSIGSALSSTECSGEYSDSDKSTISMNKDDYNKQANQKGLVNTESSRIINDNKKIIPKYYCDSWTDHGSKKDSGLESGDVSDASEELQPTAININAAAAAVAAAKSSMINNKNNELILDRIKDQSQSHDSLLKYNSNSVILNKLNNANNKPVHEMKIRSALATSILQLRKGVITKTKPVMDIGNCRRAGAYIVGLETGNPKVKQMVSVLKKPPQCVSGSSTITGNPNESIVTTTNSSNGEVQNIIIQDMGIESNADIEEAKKPARRKLNLAEYRSRRDKNRSDNSRTNSPVQPMALIYIHHVSTTTEPIKDDPDNPVWSEREIVSVLKPKADIEEEKNRPKISTQDSATQTNETVFDSPAKTNTINNENRTSQIRERKNRQYRRRSSSSSSSRSRSRSRSRNRSRSRSNSHRRSNTRRRRISHRRSSVSSSSSWSSRSRSRSRSTSRSLSRSRSRSRSSRSRSRSISRSSSRYSSCSRSSSTSSTSNSGKGKRSGQPRRRSRRGHGSSYYRHRRHSSDTSHSYRSWRRSSSSLRRKPYDTWTDREKQRQVEERRVIYVGRLEEGVLKADLRRRFEAFGPVVDISVHFREHGDNYGFVTFAYKNDAYEAVEHGNDDPTLPRYDLCFGGRRAFCKVKYADLDGIASNSLGGGRGGSKLEEGNSFDLLLKEAQAKLRKRKV